MEKIGKKTWAIAEGYIPKWGHGKEPEFVSHETMCVLNTNEEDAELSVFIYFTDKEPVGPYKIKIPAQRVKHIRFNDLSEPEPIPKGVDFASLVHASLPVIVQHTRLDSRQSENALLSTMAYGE